MQTGSTICWSRPGSAAKRGNGCSCSTGVLGHTRNLFSVSQVRQIPEIPAAAQTQVTVGLQKVRVRVCHSLCVTSMSPWPVLCSCSGSSAGGPDGQTGSTALPGAASSGEGDRLSLTPSFTAPGFINPGGFYNPLGCGGVCPGKEIHRITPTFKEFPLPVAHPVPSETYLEEAQAPSPLTGGCGVGSVQHGA